MAAHPEQTSPADYLSTDIINDAVQNPLLLFVAAMRVSNMEELQTELLNPSWRVGTLSLLPSFSTAYCKAFISKGHACCCDKYSYI